VPTKIAVFLPSYYVLLAFNRSLSFGVLLLSDFEIFLVVFKTKKILQNLGETLNKIFHLVVDQHVLIYFSSLNFDSCDEVLDLIEKSSEKLYSVILAIFKIQLRIDVDRERINDN